MSKTIFQRIIDREIPAKIEHEDDLCIVLHDIQPQAPVAPCSSSRKTHPRVGEATPEDQALLGHLLLTAGARAKKSNLGNGFRLVTNNGPDGGEKDPVPHLHVHLLAKRPLARPPRLGATSCALQAEPSARFAMARFSSSIINTAESGAAPSPVSLGQRIWASAARRPQSRQTPAPRRESDSSALPRVCPGFRGSPRGESVLQRGSSPRQQVVHAR